MLIFWQEVRSLRDECLDIAFLVASHIQKMDALIGTRRSLASPLYECLQDFQGYLHTSLSLTLILISSRVLKDIETIVTEHANTPRMTQFSRLGARKDELARCRTRIEASWRDFQVHPIPLLSSEAYALKITSTILLHDRIAQLQETMHTPPNPATYDNDGVRTQPLPPCTAHP